MVPVMYFEGKTFVEQVSFMSSTDIVISPHGAQLISLPFMPSGGAVLELFPPHYLNDGTFVLFFPIHNCLPDQETLNESHQNKLHFIEYFGSLSAISGIEHNYIYLGDDSLDRRDKVKIAGHSLATMMARAATRRVRLCPPIDTVVHATLQIVQRWQDRCRSQNLEVERKRFVF